MIDKEGYYVLIPNEKLISTNIENLTKRETRRADFSI
jgi:small-conductance mechanosensitive channel